MPSKKSGTAGNLQSPVDATAATDALDGQAGATETAQAAGQDRGTKTMTVSSTTVSAEQDSDDATNAPQ
jgi:hypothetical protein